MFKPKQKTNNTEPDPVPKEKLPNFNEFGKNMKDITATGYHQGKGLIKVNVKTTSDKNFEILSDTVLNFEASKVTRAVSLEMIAICTRRIRLDISGGTARHALALQRTHLRFCRFFCAESRTSWPYASREITRRNMAQATISCAIFAFNRASDYASGAHACGDESGNVD